jgi:hypothetical protein
MDKKKKRKFTEDELKYIQVHVKDKTIAEIAKDLNRYYTGVYLNSLKFKGRKTNYIFSEEDDAYIRACYAGNIRVKVIAQHLGLTEQQVYNHVRHLGLKK